MTVQIYSAAPMERKLNGNLHFYYYSFMLLPSNVSCIYVARSENVVGSVLFMRSTCIAEVSPGDVVIGKLCTSVRSSLILVIADQERTVDFYTTKGVNIYYYLDKTIYYIYIFLTTHNNSKF